MLFTLFILKMGRFQTFGDGALRSENWARQQREERLPLTEQPAGKAWPRRRPWKTEEGSSGSDTIALCTAAEGHASMQSSVSESSRGYREGVGMPFQVRTTHLGVWGPIHHQRDIKAQGDCGASEHLKVFLSFTQSKRDEKYSYYINKRIHSQTYD